MPETREFRFSRLPWRELTGRDPEWYILWDPVLEIDPEQPDRSSPTDIAVLQTVLRKQGLYSYRIDGKYGPRTQKALRAYKRARGLDPERGLNARTLLFLCRDLRSDPPSARGDRAP